MKTGNEDCDGPDLGGKTCQTEGYDFGDLGCSDHCVFDTSNCQLDPPIDGTFRAGDVIDDAIPFLRHIIYYIHQVPLPISAHPLC